MSVSDNDPVVSVFPIHLTNSLADNVQLHQFPLLTRPLQIPPSAAQSGKKIRARSKRKAGRLELHVPFDTRTEVWNKERGLELGQARAEDDTERSGPSKQKSQASDPPRLADLRLKSEPVPRRCAYALGVIRDGMSSTLFTIRTTSFWDIGKLHLHLVNEVHQFRPTLTYLDVHMRKHGRRPTGHDSGSDSDDGPPPDPDEPAAAPVTKKEKTRKVGEDAKEVHVAMKRGDDKGVGAQGGLSNVRREMLMLLREEDDEPWQDILFNTGDVSTEISRSSFGVGF